MGGLCGTAQAVEKDEEVACPEIKVREAPGFSASARPAESAEAEASPVLEADLGDEGEDCGPPPGEAPMGDGDDGVSSGKVLIGRQELGPPISLMDPTQPDWRFELDKGKWKSYTLEESIELDRYWKVFCSKRDGGSPELCLAKVSLSRKEGVVDFEAMTVKVGEFRPRKLQRNVKEAGWLSNTYFWEAFKGALVASGAELEVNKAEDVFDFRWNQDFRGMKDDGRPLYRGGQRYELPMGWKRFAVHVKGLYDSGDNSWLKEDESGWAVAYHGTSGAGLAGILSSGFNKGARQKFEGTTGAGIYCTPFINVAQHYSRPQMQEGHSVQIVLQLRVRPSAIKQITDPKATDFEKKYWVINNGEDIRAYGVLIRELAVKDYVCPEEMVFGKDHPATKKAYASLK